MSEPRNLAVARDLFTSGSGGEAERLVLHKLPLPFGSLGGWSLPAVAARLALALNAEREEGAREEREAVVRYGRLLAKRAESLLTRGVLEEFCQFLETGQHVKEGEDA